MPSSNELLDKVVDLINKAKVEAKEQKTYLLAQTDFNANCRKFVASFLRDVVRAHPRHVGLVVPVASYLMHDSTTSVKKVAVLLANTIYRPALQRLVDNGNAEGAQQDWSVLEGLRKVVLNTITSGPADISMIAVKFAETFVLACVGGRGLAAGASRAGDKSVQRDLSHSHPFLKADTLDQAGHALARQMVGWLGSNGNGNGNSSGGGAAAKGAGWGSGFGAQHYTVLINALQSLATNRAALFEDIVPALASALESINGKVQVDGSGAGKKRRAAAATAAGAVSSGLQGAASSLRSACLKLLKVAPAASRSVQRLATAAALSGSDGEAKAAVEGNSALNRGRITLPARPKAQPKHQPAAAPPARVLALTAEDRCTFADLAASACLGKVPKPPPGYKFNRTPGFPLADLEMLFGHVLNALGPNLATVRSHTIPTDAAGSGNTGEGKAGNKRTRSPAPEVAGGNKRRSRDGTEENGKVPETGKAPMDVVREEGVGQSKGDSGTMVVKSELEPKPEPADPLEEGLEAAKQAFSRVLAVWEGAATEGKRELHQRVISRLGRMLAEAEVAAMVAQGGNGSKSKVVEEVVAFITKDYRKRFKAALALLTEFYAADVAAASMAAKEATAPAQPQASKKERGVKPKGKPRGFGLYDEALVSLLSNLSGSLEATWRQKLFTQTLVECPRVPPAALELVCGLCDMAATPHGVQTGLVALKDLIFHKPATRGVCIPSVLRFTYHSNNDVRTKAVRLASNLLWPDPAFQPMVEAFAKQALASVRSPETKEEIREVKVEAKSESVKPSPTSKPARETQEQDVLDFDGDDEEEEEAAAASQIKVRPPTPSPTPSVGVLGPWLAPPETEATARVRLSLYFALCVKSRPMLSGLLEAYVTAAPSAQAGLMAELPLLAKAAAKGFGEPGVVGLVAAAPHGAQAFVLAMLDLLVPWDTNKPSPELVAAVRRLREKRVATEAAVKSEKMEGGENTDKADEAKRTAGIEYVVPILAGLGREGVRAELPALLQADDDVVRAAFKRLTRPAKGSIYTPSELVVLLNQFDYTAAGLPTKRLTRALSLCLDNKAVYNYPVLREALNIMSQVPSTDKGESGGAKQLPFLLMRTVMVSVATFPELKNFVATAVLPRLVQHKVWTQPRIWDGFLRCAKMMAKESGATSFIAMVQLPDDKLKEALGSPLMKGVKESLRRYAQTLVKVDPGVQAVLGL